MDRITAVPPEKIKSRQTWRCQLTGLVKNLGLVYTFYAKPHRPMR
jgi:hypothetical protein